MDKIQACTTINMILMPMILIGGTVLFFVWEGPLLAVGYALGLLLYVYFYRRTFPRFSRFLGYGELKDEK